MLKFIELGSLKKMSLKEQSKKFLKKIVNSKIQMLNFSNRYYILKKYWENINNFQNVLCLIL
jgi:hypothetical protein